MDAVAAEGGTSLVGRFVRTGDWLDHQTFPTMSWAVPGLIPEGMGLLVGGPKAGKSWLAYGLSLAIAQGDDALGGITTGTARPVLVMALEDGDRRMKSRRQVLMGDQPTPTNLHFVTLDGRPGADGAAIRMNPADALPLVEEWLDLYGHLSPLVIIDTLTKALPSQALPGETEYRRDYRVGSRLKALADAHSGTTVLVVHHTRKMSADDFVDTVSGTNGLAGAADFICVLNRARTESKGVLSVTGRDVTEAEYALVLTDVGRWVLDGASLTEAASNASDVRASSGLSDRSSAVVEYVVQHPEGIAPRDVADALEMSNDHAGKYLRRLTQSGRIDSPKRGIYTPVRSVRVSDAEGAFGQSDGSDTSAGKESP